MSVIFLIYYCILFIPSSLGLLTQFTLNDFRKILMRANQLVVITGAGISAESGVPTFRDPYGHYRNKNVHRLATLSVFKEDPASVWEYYHYRRELTLNKKPNKAHIALAKCEKWFKKEGRNLTIITQNVDGLHQKAGSKNIMELHGSLFETKCTRCGKIEKNFDSPICKGLEGREKLFNETFERSNLTKKNLPHCKDCGGLLRPNVVFFNEHLDENLSKQAWALLDRADLGMIIGTSSAVFPACLYGTHMARKGIPVAEFNLKKGPYTDAYRFFYAGYATVTVPDALNKDWNKKGDNPRETWEYMSVMSDQISIFSSSGNESSSISSRPEPSSLSFDESSLTGSSSLFRDKEDFVNDVSGVPSDIV